MKKLIKEKYYNWFLPAIKTGFKNTLNALWDLKTSLLILPIISALAYLWQWFMTVKYPNDFQLNIPSQLDFLIVGVLKFVVIYIIFKVLLRLIAPDIYKIAINAAEFWKDSTPKENRLYTTLIYFCFLFALIWVTIG